MSIASFTFKLKTIFTKQIKSALKPFSSYQILLSVFVYTVYSSVTIGHVKLCYIA